MKLIDEIKKTIVFIGYDLPVKKDKTKDIFIGTGFLLNIEGFFHIGTAKHVVYNEVTKKIRSNLWVAIKLKKGKYQKVYFDQVKTKYHVEWIFHRNRYYDIGLLPIELNEQDNDYKLIPKDLFLQDPQQNKPQELLQVFFCSYQPGIDKVNDINPILRTGFISRNNSNHTLIVDANTFPGNSGSPVFVAPTTGLINDNGVQLGNPLSGKFIGVITSYIPYKDVAVSQQTGNVRIVFEENTGLAYIHDHYVIEEIIKSQKFSKQLKHLKSLNTQNGTTS